MSDIAEETKAIPEVHLEIKSGFHTKGSEYPTHDFSAFETMYGGKPPSSMTLAINNEMLKVSIDETHERFPDKDTIMYFYLAPKV